MADEEKPAAAPANAAPVVDPPAATPSTPAPAPAAAATPPPAAAAPSSEAAKPAVEAPKVVEVKKEDLKMPEGSLLDPKTVDEIIAFSKEKGISKEAAQGILDRESKLLSSHVEGQTKKFAETQAQWTEQARTDPEFGGEKFAENVESANRVFKHFGTEGFMKLLDASKAGNHPEVLKVFNRIGRALGVMDDKFIIADGSASGEDKDAATLLFGKTMQEENK